MPSILLFLLGLGILFGGAEILIRSSSKLASILGLSPLLIGLVVVAVGTSAPEAAVTVASAYQDLPDVGVGNIIGSNICNVLLILGLSAALRPLHIRQRLVRLDVPIMIGVSLVAAGLAIDYSFGRWDGLILLAGAAAYLTMNVMQGRLEKKSVEQEYVRQFGSKRPKRRMDLLVHGALVLMGLGLLVAGTQWVVGGAVQTARYLGVSELIIGLTIVAMGTSLPELAASVVAAHRGESDIAVGNIIGSNIMNLLWVLGMGAAVSPGPLEVSESALFFDIPVMVAVSVSCLPIFMSGHRVARWKGILFLFFYAAYTSYLVLESTQPGLARTWAAVLMFFVLPLTIVAFSTITVRSFRESRAKP